jgi:hypothetical protein
VKPRPRTPLPHVQRRDDVRLLDAPCQKWRFSGRISRVVEGYPWLVRSRLIWFHPDLGSLAAGTRTKRTSKVPTCRNHASQTRYHRRGTSHDAAVVERERRLPDLAAQLRGRRRRRDRRSSWYRLAAGLPRGIGGGRVVTVTDLSVAAGRRRLRRVRQDSNLRPAD